MPEPNLEEMCKDLAEVDQFRHEYQQFEQRKARTSAINEISKRVTGEEIDYTRMPDEARAEQVNDLQKRVNAAAIAYIRPNLANLVKQTPQDKLVYAMSMSIDKHESEKYAELAGLLAQYQAMQLQSQTQDEKQAQSIENALLHDFIVDRIKGKVAAEDVEAITKIVLSAAPYDPKYASTVLKEGKAAVITRLEAYDKNQMAAYIKEQFGDDDKKYLAFASMIGSAPEAKKKK